MTIEIQGDSPAVDQFLDRLRIGAPAVASISSIETVDLEPRGETAFTIAASLTDRPGSLSIPPDLAPCDDCLAELFDPRNRRFRYPFINCTNCGPRLTIVTDAPYDRLRTTMSSFTMCTECRREYEDPRDRRFHAQPIACAECGPRLRLLPQSGEIPTNDPLTEFAKALLAGAIGAVKGVGGFHLACLAGDPQAVNELRRRKSREEKPFAVMVRDLQQAQQICEVNVQEAQLLCSPEAPIVLLNRRWPGNEAVAESVAPGNPHLGVMLPSSPLHHLLLGAMDGRLLVMTSGNVSDEPTIYEDDEAISGLRCVADFILTHNRPIYVRCDDSVTRVVRGRPSPIRVGRGAAPTVIPIASAAARSVLSVGGQLKGTFALSSAGRAIVSQHLGDLDHLAAHHAFEREIRLYENLFDVRPDVLVHDLHPDYASTRYAQARALKEGLTTIAVQHHHAHIVSAMVEHELDAPVIGVAFDGAGYGPDGAIWGGEFLVCDRKNCERAGHLRYVGLPGGDAAVREPWRAAIAHCLDAGVEPPVDLGSAEGRMFVTRMVEQRICTPMTSSMGRLFDAVAAMLGRPHAVRYEAQAAIELEWLAAKARPQQAYEFDFECSTGRTNQFANGPASFEVDTRPMIRQIVRDRCLGIDQRVIARRFHGTIVEMALAVCRRLRRSRRLAQVVLSGGVFMNRLLLQECTDRLEAAGFHVYCQQKVPANDGGLSLGQLGIALARLSHPTEPGDQPHSAPDRGQQSC